MNRLKILVFEYTTGGGLNKSELPEILAGEGLIMLQALVDSLSSLDVIELAVMLDYRMAASLVLNESVITHIISSEQHCHAEFLRLMKTCDAVWPIAPETGSLLRNLCAEVRQAGKLLLTSPASAVEVAGNKWLTYEQLIRHSITTIPTQKLIDFKFTHGEWIIKAVDGVGCEDSYLIVDEKEFNSINAVLNKGRYIIQPHIQGQKTSLSCLFKKGRGWLVCANLQHFTVKNKQYHLTEITVNYTAHIFRYQALVDAVAKAMTNLWGYVGIDLIETSEQLFILEINPRLTTSFAGIQAACGINCARVVLELLANEPRLQRTRNQAVSVKTPQHK
ncbi:MAG: ATP-grasp domain-containing protein [Methyloglobulus sp.]|nr:ATP-grasp domain-containing protein [Methyloglobulus sp.]